MSKTPYEQMMDTRFVCSMMPQDLRNEIEYILTMNPTHEEALWWNQASDEDYQQLANHMMNDDYFWNVWRETLYDAMCEEKRHIEIRRKELQDKQ